MSPLPENGDGGLRSRLPRTCSASRSFHPPGYFQVCEKWLKDRQKAHWKLSVDDIGHYQKIVVALKETIRLMAEIDALIPAWPIA